MYLGRLAGEHPPQILTLSKKMAKTAASLPPPLPVFSDPTYTVSDVYCCRFTRRQPLMTKSRDPRRPPKGGIVEHTSSSPPFACAASNESSGNRLILKESFRPSRPPFAPPAPLSPSPPPSPVSSFGGAPNRDASRLRPAVAVLALSPSLLSPVSVDRSEDPGFAPAVVEERGGRVRRRR